MNLMRFVLKCSCFCSIDVAIDVAIDVPVVTAIVAINNAVAILKFLKQNSGQMVVDPGLNLSGLGIGDIRNFSSYTRFYQNLVIGTWPFRTKYCRNRFSLTGFSLNRPFHIRS